MLLRLLVFSLVALSAGCIGTVAPKGPIKALLITGGCCHDYILQAKQLTEGSKPLAEIEWTVINEGGRGTRAQIPLYDNPDWAKGYDVVVHNECFADTNDPDYIRKITNGHKTHKVPGVVIHCAMHSYRAATIDDWREFLGVTSRRHDHQSRYPVKTLVKDHPAMSQVPADWTTPMDELYVIEKVWPKTTALATSKSERDGNDYPVIWTSDYHGARIFGTTYGHSNATWHDPIFVGMVVRGVKWAAGRE